MSDFRKSLSGSLFQNKNDLFVAVGVLMVIAMMLVPLPTVLLDAFM